MTKMIPRRVSAQRFADAYARAAGLPCPFLTTPPASFELHASNQKEQSHGEN